MSYNKASVKVSSDLNACNVCLMFYLRIFHIAIEDKKTNRMHVSHKIFHACVCVCNLATWMTYLDIEHLSEHNKCLICFTCIF